MLIFIRTDASKKIGSGHLMRCLVLANELKKRSHDVEFICHQLDPSWLELVEKVNGFRCHKIKDLSSETSKNIILNAEKEVDVLVVDHYQLDASWEKTFTSIVQRLFVIDDLADRPHYCDDLIDPNESHTAEHYQHLLPVFTSTHCGAKYALLHPSFENPRGTERPTTKQILVNFGSYDQTEQTLKAIHAFQAADLKNWKLLLLTGRDENLKKQIAPFENGKDIISLPFSNDMAGLLQQCDLSIGAGGTSVYEKCALGVPCLVIMTADNQHAGCKVLKERKAIDLLGEAKDVTVDQLKQALKDYCHSELRRDELSANAKKLVDARGRHRVCELIDEKFSFVSATSDDCRLTHTWRNDPQNRKHSYQSDDIRYDEHQQWFEQTLQNPERKLLITRLNGTPVAVVRFDLEGYKATISIYLKPGMTGKGLGSKILKKSSKWVLQQLPEVKTILADIQPGNEASIKAFSKAGYQQTGPESYELKLTP